jgi:predicted nucleic acid-binding protein
MTFLLDTNAISDLMVEHPPLGAHLTRAVAAGDAVITCTTVLGELLFGIERLVPGRRRTDLSQKLQRVLPGIACIPTPTEAAEHYARMKREGQTLGFIVDENDLWIAATSMAIGATLVTRDRDFGRIPGLALADWSV